MFLSKTTFIFLYSNLSLKFFNPIINKKLRNMIIPRETNPLKCPSSWDIKTEREIVPAPTIKGRDISVAVSSRSSFNLTKASLPPTTNKKAIENNITPPKILNASKSTFNKLENINEPDKTNTRKIKKEITLALNTTLTNEGLSNSFIKGLRYKNNAKGFNITKKDTIYDNILKQEFSSLLNFSPHPTNKMLQTH